MVTRTGTSAAKAAPYLKWLRRVLKSTHSEALVGLYSGMKPESAAAHFAQLDDDVAASLMLRMKSKVSSLILAEMDAMRGAALVKVISDLRNANPGKKP